jgi:DNA-binding response OmpR family regulator
MNYKILVVGDKEACGSVLIDSLLKEGCVLIFVPDDIQAVECLQREKFDLALLNPASSQEVLTNLSDFPGQSSLRKLFLEKIDQSLSQLKEMEGIQAFPIPEVHSFTFDNGLSVDLNRREIRYGAAEVVLTPTEGKLIKVLLDHRGQALTHQELVLLVQGYDASEWEAAEVLRPLVSRLRRKLAMVPDHKIWISSVRGTGYVLDLN